MAFIFSDISRLKAFLVNSKIFKDNNPLYQTIDGLIIAARELQKAIESGANQLEGLNKVLTYGTASERADFVPANLPGVLIVFYETDTQILYGFTGSDWEQIAASAFATYLTADDETVGLPNSLQLLAGTNITFDDSVPNQRTISAGATDVLHPFLLMGA